MGKLNYMDDSGHGVLEWTPPAEQETADDKATEDEARAKFDEMIAFNYLGYSGGLDGAPAEQIKQFDPDAESITFTPPMQGG